MQIIRLRYVFKNTLENVEYNISSYSKQNSGIAYSLIVLRNEEYDLSNLAANYRKKRGKNILEDILECEEYDIQRWLMECY